MDDLTCTREMMMLFDDVVDGVNPPAGLNPVG